MKVALILFGLIYLISVPAQSFSKFRFTKYLGRKIVKRQFAYIPEVVTKKIYVGKYKADDYDVQLSFLFSKTAVTNKEYLDFCTHSDSVSINLPDTLLWRNVSVDNVELLVDGYLRLPEYENFPVVGVSYNQALRYCSWLANELNKKIKDTTILCEVMLPTVAERKYADGQYETKYPWGDQLMTARNNKLVFMLNHGDTHDSFGNIVVSKKDDGCEFIAPVKSFYKNKLGIYQLQGNVKEWLYGTNDQEPKVTNNSWYSSLSYPKGIHTLMSTYQFADLGFRVVIKLKTAY